MTQNFIDLLKSNPDQKYGNPILTKNDIINAGLATEEDIQHLEDSESAKILYTELYLLKKEKAKLEFGETPLRELRKKEIRLTEIEIDTDAIEGELIEKIEVGRVRAYNQLQRQIHDDNLKEFETLLDKFITLDREIRDASENFD